MPRSEINMGGLSNTTKILRTLSEKVQHWREKVQAKLSHGGTTQSLSDL
jgi:hypothetical protein